MLVDQKLSHFHHHRGTSAKVLLQLLSPQVKISVLHPQRLLHLSEGKQKTNRSAS